MTAFRFAAFAVILTLAGCTVGGTAPVADDTVTVEGTVAEIDDQTPVDGGVTIDLNVADGGTERLLFASLFTVPPPSDARIALYQRIQAVEVGSRVRASGVRGEDGIELTDLVVLDP
ncbi:MAG: hypothetical protein RLN75_07495 [Longimicrobiales bacterium]